jgi:hypothetical protein
VTDVDRHRQDVIRRPAKRAQGRAPNGPTGGLPTVTNGAHRTRRHAYEPLRAGLRNIFPN